MIFKAVRNRWSGTLLIAATFAFVATVAAVSGQDNPDMEAGDADPTPAPQPLVLHVHHHYYTNQGGEYQYTPAYRTYLGAGVFGNQTPVIQKYSQAFPVHAQTVVGGLVEPWKQNWGHLGFTAYLGQQGEKTGLIVDTVTPDSAAEKMGLIPGDFILKINGTPATGYRQVAALFEQTAEDPKHQIALEIWNPHTRRTNNVSAVLQGDKNGVSP